MTTVRQKSRNTVAPAPSRIKLSIMNDYPTLAALSPRSIEEIADAAQVVQANIVALRVAHCKRTGQSAEQHDIKTPPPGRVRQMRDALIDREVLRNYSDDEILLRLRQVWGEFCALCWLFPHVDVQNPICFDPLPEGQSLRCLGQVHEKIAEVQTGLWRVRHEYRHRTDPNALSDPEFLRDNDIAITRSISVFGQNISVCTASELFAGACEFAGMLAALRWVTDDRWTWEAPGIMDLSLRLGTQAPVELSLNETTPNRASK